MNEFIVDIYNVSFSDRICTIISGEYFVEVVGSEQVATLEEYTDSFNDLAALDKYFSLHCLYTNGE